MFRVILLSVFTWLTLVSVFSQVKNVEFEKFATKQQQLCIEAYEKRDAEGFTRLMDGLIKKFEKLSESDKKDFSVYVNNGYYNLCCTHSLVNNKQMAISCLKKSLDAGYSGYQHNQTDTDLDNIRLEPEYLKLNSRLRNIGDFLHILKNAKTYNLQDNRPIPDFKYQTQDDQNLILLRKKLNLDSIAGNGSEVLKILNLLRWMHNLVPHDGSKENPSVKNALSMIAECKRENRGLNCRGLATALNECYLAMGIKSKIVTCLPKDSLKTDNDCHVINSVYSESLQKWLWIDPTFNAYIMNENGEMLSIEEVRQRLTENKTVILNPDANWNNQYTQTKEDYLFKYMAKNLSILESPSTSEYNLETKLNGKINNYIQLLPLDYYSQSPDINEVKQEKTNSSIITFKTNNSSLFWKKP